MPWIVEDICRGRTSIVGDKTDLGMSGADSGNAWHQFILVNQLSRRVHEKPQHTRLILQIFHTVTP